MFENQETYDKSTPASTVASMKHCLADSSKKSGSLKESIAALSGVSKINTTLNQQS